MEYNFLFFNLADLPSGVAPQIKAHQAFLRRDLPSGVAPQIKAHQAFLRRKSFRQAVSAAIDRDAIIRLVYLGRAVPLAGPVPPGNQAWIDTSLPEPIRSVERARQLLSADGFHWSRQGALADPQGRPVEF